MKNKQLLWLVALLASVMVMASFTRTASAMQADVLKEEREFAKYQLETQSPIQSAVPTLQSTEAPESREMPPIGNNALLVFGASVLVLIIIGGVLISSRLKSKH
jgi:hypothetical protein